ncbi:MAG TPA: class I tRNA ligase family protein [Thermoplasmata archaeon]|nr:class I tRNA ligase family protein [Thermoplasmata archaeon]
MPLFVPDTLTRQLAAVRRRPPAPVRLYVCGPTVYDSAHVGHARTYLYFDIVRRWFDVEGVPVRHVMNITDFEDKITARAAALGMTWCALARREEQRFLTEMRALRVKRPHSVPRASRFVPAMVDAIRRLDRRGAIERRPDGWYFRGTPAASARNFDVGPVLARHAVSEPGHPFPQDPAAAREFLVWKPQEDPAPSWPSPWGPGMPGWHLECFVMAERYLGLPVDLHGGGVDLVYPHHFAENEVAETLQHRPFSRVFLHTAFVTAGGKKMAKSSGNLVLLRHAVETFGPDALRWYLLGRPVSEAIEWNEREARRARSDHERVRKEVGGFLENGASGSLDVAKLRRAVGGIRARVTKGFHVEAALSDLREYVAEAARAPNPRFARGERREAASLFRGVEALLGLKLR